MKTLTKTIGFYRPNLFELEYDTYPGFALAVHKIEYRDNGISFEAIEDEKFSVLRSLKEISQGFPMTLKTYTSTGEVAYEEKIVLKNVAYCSSPFSWGNSKNRLIWEVTGDFK